jgi:hypothetical protein
MVRLLLATGADPTIRATSRRSALDVAKTEKEVWVHIRRTTPQVLSVINRPFEPDFDAVIAMLEEAISERPAR